MQKQLTEVQCLNICDDMMILQGLFVPFPRVGSGDPVRVLRLLHNQYTGAVEAFIGETYALLVATESMWTLVERYFGTVQYQQKNLFITLLI